MQRPSAPPVPRQLWKALLEKRIILLPDLLERFIKHYEAEHPGAKRCEAWSEVWRATPEATAYAICCSGAARTNDPISDRSLKEQRAHLLAKDMANDAMDALLGCTDGAAGDAERMQEALLADGLLREEGAQAWTMRRRHHLLLEAVEMLSKLASDQFGRAAVMQYAYSLPIYDLTIPTVIKEAAVDKENGSVARLVSLARLDSTDLQTAAKRTLVSLIAVGHELSNVMEEITGGAELLRSLKPPSNCPMCFEDLDGSIAADNPLCVVTAACGNAHGFHRRCIEAWARQKEDEGYVPSCPTCRQPFTCVLVNGTGDSITLVNPEGLNEPGEDEADELRRELEEFRSSVLPRLPNGELDRRPLAEQREGRRHLQLRERRHASASSSVRS